ncbi:NAD(P)-dependent oxidoreductase [Listeria weihenstephanensis]|uniref:NAD(P)-dependent oxidoreductase n=1 Tax=Listeria weihenstephanensis TaxID=1006155 RepID=A0A841Z3U7_9LIST|nr:NAD(P)-dependent oxidoreductase [Listeria weihenstephanensis]MBC1499878.1 NAD(P)-dependent oxidoreductase [Listeria weihenstephanensis]
MKSVFILGGTGLIGHAAISAFLATEDYHVTTFSLPPVPEVGVLDLRARHHFGNINEMSDAEIVKLLKGQDIFIFAGGVNSHFMPKKPAKEFFFQVNVEPVVHLAQLARQAGVSKFILCTSFYNYFHALWPELQLTGIHPYIYASVEQEMRLLNENGNGLTTIALRLPYVVGLVPNRVSAWVNYARRLHKAEFPLYVNHHNEATGGSCYMTAKQVGQALVGAADDAVISKSYTLGWSNISNESFLMHASKALGADIQIKPMTFRELQAKARKEAHENELAGKEAGLEPVAYTELLTRALYIDPIEALDVLDYHADNVEQEIHNVFASLDNKKR